MNVARKVDAKSVVLEGIPVKPISFVNSGALNCCNF